MANKKETLKDATKDTVKLGIASMAGMGALGAMSNVPGMPAAASGVVTTTGAGLGLANIGRMAKTGMTITRQMAPQKTVKKEKKKSYSSSERAVRKILGY